MPFFWLTAFPVTSRKSHDVLISFLARTNQIGHAACKSAQPQYVANVKYRQFEASMGSRTTPNDPKPQTFGN